MLNLVQHLLIKMKPGIVYILSNKNRTTLYIGVTSDIRSRLYRHRYENGSKFTTRYNCFDLIYYEVHSSIVAAIDREKQLKRWHKEWKLNLIKSVNPELKDLSEEVDSDPYEHK
jgi:putative endonuclease